MIALQNMLKIPDADLTAVVAVVAVDTAAAAVIVVVAVDTAAAVVVAEIAVVVAEIAVVEAVAAEETDGKVFSLNSNINPKNPGKSHFPILFSF
ncbi:MAG: hypothetical protein ACXAB2_14795 [Candidatus Hodarchaeales archaeon]|jgi:hypothetical protein